MRAAALVLAGLLVTGCAHTSGRAPVDSVDELDDGGGGGATPWSIFALMTPAQASAYLMQGDPARLSTLALTGAFSGTSGTFTGALTVLSLTTTAGSGVANITLPAGGRLFLDGTRYLSAGGSTVDVTGGVLNATSGFTTANAYTSTVGSGSNAVALTTNGARADLGAGSSDYLFSDGTYVNSASYLIAAGVPVAVVPNAAAPQCLQAFSKAAVAGVAPVDFTDEGGIDFGTAPKCWCGDASNTTETQCSTTSVTTSGVQMNGAGTNTYNLLCLGACP